MLTEKEKKLLADFESRINIPNGFYNKLLEDDDWSFIIKLHSLVEATLSYSLSESIRIAFSKYHPEGKIDLRKLFSLLETSNKDTGKLAFLKALDVPHSNYRGFIMNLSQIRNRMIHNVSNVNLTIKQYYASLKGSNKNDFMDKMTFTIPNKITVGGENLNGKELFDLHPKIAIWYNAFQCISELHYLVKLFEVEREMDKKDQEIRMNQDKILDEFESVINSYLESKST